MTLNSLGITINLQEAFDTYAEKLGQAVEWLKLMEAYRWFHSGGRLRRFWRHEVYRRLWPCRYDERRLQAEDAGRHMKRAMIAAVFERTGRKMLWLGRRQNWRDN